MYNIKFPYSDIQMHEKVAGNKIKLNFLKRKEIRKDFKNIYICFFLLSGQIYILGRYRIHFFSCTYYSKYRLI